MIKIAFIKIFRDGDPKKKSRSVTYDYLIADIQNRFGNSVDCEVCYSYRDIENFCPDIVGISTATESFMQTKSFIEFLKERQHCTIFLGGAHITALPETLPEKCCVGILGEGDKTIVELLEYFQDKRLEENLSGIKGIVYREADGTLQVTARRELPSLDTLPIPIPSIVDYDLGKAVALVTTRGCVNKCIHCSEAGIWRVYREMSADRLAYIMETQYRKTGVSDFVFMDDLSIGNIDRLKDLVRILKTKGLLGKVHIRKVSANSELVTEELVQILKQLGVALVGFGSESAAPNILKKMKCNRVKVEDFIRTIDLCTKYKIRSGSSSVFGFLGETREDLQTTRNFLVEYSKKPNTYKPFENYVCQPLPGSILWDLCLKRGQVSLDMDFSLIQTSPNLDKSDWLYLNEEGVPRTEFVTFLKSLNKELLEIKKSKKILV